MAQALLRVVHVVVRDGGVGGDAVVPEGDGALLPAEADLEVLALGDVLRRRVSLGDCCGKGDNREKGLGREDSP